MQTRRYGHARRSTRALTVRAGVALLAVVLLVVGAAGGAWRWWEHQRAAVRAASDYADGVAAEVGAGRLPPDVDITASDSGAAQVALDRLLEGMGALEHRVRVGDVDLESGNSAGLITFTHAWSIQADGDPWTYETTMPIERRGDSWTGKWGNGVVVAGLADDERVRAVRLTAERADVLGDGGVPLVERRGVVRLGIDRSAVPDATEAGRSAEQLATVIGIDGDPFVSRVTGSGPRAFVEAITYRDDADELQDAAADMNDIPGAVAVAGSLPLAPTSNFARAILGTAGEATAEIIEGSEGRVRTGDLVGLSGLQATYDESLAGKAGHVVEAVNLDTEEARPLHEVPPQDGTPLHLSLSTQHQLAAEKALQNVGPASAIVAIRPSDGHVLAAASGPGSQGYSTATLGQYAPGSTFKAVSTLALLRAGLTDSSDVDCPQTVTVDGRQFTNYGDYPPSRLGTITLRTAVAHSCNTALMQERSRLEESSLPDAAASLGLTADPALGVPAALGSVPVPDGDVDTAASMIGQGKVLSTPLGMAVVAASLQEGVPVAPVLVLDDTTPRAVLEPSLSEVEQQQMLNMLRAVVTEGGAPFLADVPGAPVAAKTGTAEFGEPDRDGILGTHAWMIGLQGDLAVAVFVERGSGGASVAGPVLKDFLVRVHDSD